MKEIQLTQGKVAAVDDQDYEWLSQWKWYAKCCRGKWYAYRNIKTEGRHGHTTIGMHQVILPLGKPLMPDHVDGNGLNNTRQNLRPATSSENMLNRINTGKTTHKTGPKGQHRQRRANRSGLLGVYFRKGCKRPYAQIKHKGECLYLGMFDDTTSAARAYDAAAKRLYGEQAIVNFPE